MCNGKDSGPRTELSGTPRFLFITGKEVTVSIYKLIAGSQNSQSRAKELCNKLFLAI